MKQTLSSAKTLQRRSRVLICAIALATCALMACTAFVLSGCKPPQGQLAANAALAEMSAIQQKNPESISFLPEVSHAEELEQIGISQEEFFGWWLEGFTSSLGDVEMNGEENDAKIFASITCKQLEPIVKQWSNEYVAWLLENKAAIEAGTTEDPLEYGRNLLKSIFENAEPTLCQTEIHLHEYDDDWSVVGDQDNGVYRDALLGSADNLSGYYSAPIAELTALHVALPANGADAQGQAQSEGEGDSSDE